MLGKLLDVLGKILLVLKEILHEVIALRSDLQELKPDPFPEIVHTNPYKDKNGLYNYKAFKNKKHNVEEVEE